MKHLKDIEDSELEEEIKIRRKLLNDMVAFSITTFIYIPIFIITII